MSRAVILIALLWPMTGHADDLPCPPKHYFCWQANLVFKKYGVSRVVAKARTCGWAREEIAEALKCKS